MPIEVEAPDGSVVEFPDGTSPEVMQRAMRQRFPKPMPKPSVATAARQGLGDVARDVSNGFFGLMDLGNEYIAKPVQDAGVNALAGLGSAVLRAGSNRKTNADPQDWASRTANGLEAWARREAAKPAPTIRGINRLANPEAPGRQSSSLPGELLGGVMLPLGPKGAKPKAKLPAAVAQQAPSVAREVVAEGAKRGVRVMTSDLKPPRTFVGKGVQALGERFPIVGTGPVRAAQQTERMEAVRNLAREYGAVSGDELTAPAINDVMADFASTRGAAVAQLAKAKKAIIDGTQGQVPVSNTVAALDAQIAKFSAVDTPAAQALVGKLRGWKEALVVPGRTEATGILDAAGNPIVRSVAPGGKSLSTIDLIREEMGTAFKDANLASIKDAGAKALQSIYGPMKTDMSAFIRQNAGQEALAQWNKSNLVLSGMADELSVSTLRSVLRTGKGTPEDVAKLLFSNKPSLVRRLYANMSSEGRVRAQAAVFQRMIEKSGGVEKISPEKFITQIKAMGRTTGIHFQEPDLARIEGFTRLLSTTARAGEAGVMTNSGQQAVPLLLGSATLSNPWLALGGISARIYESAPVRNALLKLGRTPKGSPQEAIELRRVAGMIAPLIEKYSAAMNDNVGVAAAASDGEANQQEQQDALQP